MTENHGVASPILALGTLGLVQATDAGIVQLVEHLLAKEKVTGSSPVARSCIFRIVILDIRLPIREVGIFV